MGRLRGFLWLVAGLIVAALAALVAFTTLSRATQQRAGQAVVGPQVQVVVASHTVAVRSALTAADVQVKTVAVEAAPEGAIGDTAAAVGKLTLVDLYPGEVLLAQRLVDPTLTSNDGRQALIVTGQDVLMAFPADDLMSKTGLLKAGDHVDLLFSLELPVAATGGVTTAATTGGGEIGRTGAQEKKSATFNALQNVAIAAIVGGPGGTGTSAQGGIAGAARTTANNAMSDGSTAILLTVSTQDALVLKQLKDAGAILDIVVRAPGNESPTTAEPVDLDYIINRYQIPGAGR